MTVFRGDSSANSFAIFNFRSVDPSSIEIDFTTNFYVIRASESHMDRPRTLLRVKSRRTDSNASIDDQFRGLNRGDLLGRLSAKMLIQPSKDNVIVLWGKVGSSGANMLTHMDGKTGVFKNSISLSHENVGVFVTANTNVSIFENRINGRYDAYKLPLAGDDAMSLVWSTQSGDYPVLCNDDVFAFRQSGNQVEILSSNSGSVIKSLRPRRDVSNTRQGILGG